MSFLEPYKLLDSLIIRPRSLPPFLTMPYLNPSLYPGLTYHGGIPSYRSEIRYVLPLVTSQNLSFYYTRLLITISETFTQHSPSQPFPFSFLHSPITPPFGPLFSTTGPGPTTVTSTLLYLTRRLHKSTTHVNLNANYTYTHNSLRVLSSYPGYKD